MQKKTLNIPTLQHLSFCSSPNMPKNLRKCLSVSKSARKFSGLCSKSLCHLPQTLWICSEYAQNSHICPKIIEYAQILIQQILENAKNFRICPKILDYSPGRESNSLRLQGNFAFQSHAIPLLIPVA